ncbi:MAG: hypothetical protein PHS82_00160 [Lachnospiraceae bacterium]|nr:hypothetical protein [Lachnospiraceae bacterium]
MKNKWKLRRMGLALFCVICFMNCPVQASVGTGEIQIKLKDLESAQSVQKDIEFQIYKVGTVNEDGVPQLNPEFVIQAYPQTSEELDAAAKSVSEAVTGEALKVEKTDANGILSFMGLGDGVYLVKSQKENAYGEVAPFLVHIPYYEEVNHIMTGPNYTVTAEPKASPITEKPKDPQKKPVSPTGTQNTPVKLSTAKTGDSTEVAGTLFVMLCAAIVIVEIVTKKRDRRKGA